ncbi:type II secretion system minor pseudopilin GspK [Allopusillimonas ginsengisoli]|uniref:type II secretion system minor pseudopilin GspK n=1 Tax=Allopusillimonas ginsengisoli TaxID=453575 RepID=UPI00101EF9D6|nr:type II secretion system minor pseudopilin GspK [Allopusillimonas ginsengisoli]TEA80023.1 general secretion pathway protein GspK [Allopusillimonas ginsengisoli]
MNQLVRMPWHRRPAPPGSRPRAQRGMAVIAALVVVGAAAVTTAAIMQRQALLADTLIGERERTQADWLLRGGLDWARVILFNDARRNAITRKDAIWAQPIAGLEISTPDGRHKAYFSGQIEDEQGKYNLSQLALLGAVQPGEVAVLQRLLTGLGMPASLAMTMARRVAASQSGPQREQTAPGLRTMSDLTGIEGMPPDVVAVLSNYVTVLPQKTAINVNTASAEVLSASIPGLDLAQARDLADQRDQGLWFNSRSDFLNRMGNGDMTGGSNIGVQSDWFKVTGQVTLNDSVAGMQALLHRHGGKPPQIRWVEG